MMTATASVLMMTVPGVALFYGGMVRKKNVLNTVMHSFATACLVSVLWVVCGYSLAFAEGSSFVGGLDRVFLVGLGMESMVGSVPETVYIAFQMSFAIITAALVAGAVVERMKFSALLLFLGLWSLAVYAPVAHWVWGGGFLSSAGVLDFAGGTVVHINSGIAALVAAAVLGRRMGYGSENMAPHNVVLTIIGASLSGLVGSDSTRAPPSPQTVPRGWPCWRRSSPPPLPRLRGCSRNGPSAGGRACSA